MKKPIKTKETVGKGGQVVIENKKPSGSGGSAAPAGKDGGENG